MHVGQELHSHSDLRIVESVLDSDQVVWSDALYRTVNIIWSDTYQALLIMSDTESPLIMFDSLSGESFDTEEYEIMLNDDRDIGAIKKVVELDETIYILTADSSLYGGYIDQQSDAFVLHQVPLLLNRNPTRKDVRALSTLTASAFGLIAPNALLNIETVGGMLLLG